jgi:hypothetical protein
MKWRKIADAFKRLDNGLSDAVYLHGCYLTGQEKITRSHGRPEPKDQSQALSSSYPLRGLADSETMVDPADPAGLYALYIKLQPDTHCFFMPIGNIRARTSEGAIECQGSRLALEASPCIAGGSNVPNGPYAVGDCRFLSLAASSGEFRRRCHRQRTTG